VITSGWPGEELVHHRGLIESPSSPIAAHPAHDRSYVRALAAASPQPRRPGRAALPSTAKDAGTPRSRPGASAQHLAAAEAGAITSPADTDSPVTMARVTGVDLLRALRAEADRVSGIADRLRQAVETVTDPTAAEAEVEAIRAAAEQRAAAAEARAAAAEQRAAEAGQWRADAEAAAEEMAARMDAAQARADQAEAAGAAAETDRDAAIGQAPGRRHSDRQRRSRPGRRSRAGPCGGQPADTRRRGRPGPDRRPGRAGRTGHPASPAGNRPRTGC
jgi:hypothetical protein